MDTTYFQIFIDAFSVLGERERLLDGDIILCPPSADYGYSSTPRNALTFAAMGVDGVHTAILKIEDQVRDDSPVVSVRPMDSNDVIVLAGSFISFLAEGCGRSISSIQTSFDAEQADKRQLVAYLGKHFKRARLFSEERTDQLKAQYGHFIKRRTGSA